MVIRKKKEYRAETASTYTCQQPIKKKVIQMPINPDEWGIMNVMEPGVRRHFEVRVSFDSAGTKFYSLFYEVVFDDACDA